MNSIFEDIDQTNIIDSVNYKMHELLLKGGVNKNEIEFFIDFYNATLYYQHFIESALYLNEMGLVRIKKKDMPKLQKELLNSLDEKLGSILEKVDIHNEVINTMENLKKGDLK